MTLTSLANSERQADAKRFLETLRNALANPSAWQPNPAPPAEPETETGPSSPSTGNTLDDDLKLLDVWLELDEAARPGAVEAHVSKLSNQQLSSFKTNLEEAQSNVTQRIADHRENEARYAAGRFVEDQMSYRMSRIAGAPPNADWLATLQNYERVKGFIEGVHRFVSAVDQERRHPPAPPPLSATPSRERKEATQPAQPSSISPQIQALRQMLESELASGKIQPDRAPAYRRVLDKIESLSQAHERGEITPEAAEAQTQALMADFMRYVADPGTASVQATPAARELLRYAGALKTTLLRQFKDTPPASTAEAVGAIMGDVTKAQTEAAKAGDSAALAAIEAEVLRPAARAWHDLSLTHHAVLARPLWESNEVMRTVNTLFYSGAKDLQTTLERVAESKRLSVDDTRRLQNHGQLRWDALNACHVAVFDLRLAADVEGLALRAPKQAREITGAAYELGLAFALGKPVVLLADPAAALPFDIDLSPVRIDGTADDEDAIAQALDEAFYVAQREGRGNAIPDSLKELDRLTRDHPRRASIEGMGWLDPSLKKDPAGFAAAVRQVLREIDEPQRQLLRPAWPGAYPDATQPRCFHVMPFGPSWANEVRDTARAVCQDLGLIYRRGDEAEEGRIIQAVWDDLCRASVVLVELHGGNLNVMIELGIAHALGRPVLAVQRSGAQDLRPRHIEKLRVHMYNTTEELQSILESRLKA